MIRKKFYFQCGLPRTGSTLLTAILNQNPRIHSSAASPLCRVIEDVIESFSNSDYYKADPRLSAAENVIKQIPHSFYEEIEKPVIIDKDRRWGEKSQMIKSVFDTEPKFICQVRPVEEILTSLILLLRKNKYEGGERLSFVDENLIKCDMAMNDENRCMWLLNEKAPLGEAISSLRKLNQNEAIIIEYKDLVENPSQVMNSIYDFLGEERYCHDFNNIQDVSKVDDSGYNVKGLHDMRSKISMTSTPPEDVLPEKILRLCKEIPLR